ncbi:basic salivary proline-rich protein 4-like [Nannospalax galili]|uniref:basic salivary proline-rich protein 4-like n=1 Tax=Nannospalax galili TaxID=1026970 RepID=UPI00111C2469|nr:basic salivary proline-rich protein 4-like [Nannospalax galili]
MAFVSRPPAEGHLCRGPSRQSGTGLRHVSTALRGAKVRDGKVEPEAGRGVSETGREPGPGPRTSRLRTPRSVLGSRPAPRPSGRGLSTPPASHPSSLHAPPPRQCARRRQASAHLGSQRAPAQHLQSEGRDGAQDPGSQRTRKMPPELAGIPPPRWPPRRAACHVAAPPRALRPAPAVPTPTGGLSTAHPDPTMQPRHCAQYPGLCHRRPLLLLRSRLLAGRGFALHVFKALQERGPRTTRRICKLLTFFSGVIENKGKLTSC